MKILFFALALCLSAVSVLSAGSVADLDSENGLPTAKIGARRDSFQGLVQIEDAGRWLTFKDPGEKLSYAGFPVVGIKYNFFKDKLYSINVAVEGRRSTRGILKALEANFGSVHSLEKHHFAKADSDSETREWAGQKLYLLYRSAVNGIGGEITFLDKPMWDQLQVPREQRKAVFREMMGGSFSNGDF